MGQLKIFENEEFGQIRTVMRDGEVWFVGKDVAEALGFTNSRDAIATHVKRRFEEAVQYIQRWRPCTNTQIQIRDCNAQVCMP